MKDDDNLTRAVHLGFMKAALQLLRQARPSNNNAAVEACNAANALGRAVQLETEAVRTGFGQPPPASFYVPFAPVEVYGCRSCGWRGDECTWSDPSDRRAYLALCPMCGGRL